VSIEAQIEQGRNRDPQLQTLRSLARALGVTIDELAGQPPGEEPAARPRRRCKPKE
jgi:transcriptional regulator with XRE-family HTH domain